MRTNMFAAALVLVGAATAWAQATAQLGGAVKDESGGVLPGVTVTVTQTDTAFTSTVVTDGMAGDPRIMQFGIKYGF